MNSIPESTMLLCRTITHTHTRGFGPAQVTSACSLGAPKLSFLVLCVTVLIELNLVARPRGPLADRSPAVACKRLLTSALNEPQRPILFTYGYGRVQDLAGIV